jgi:hypothetical protein
MQNYYEPGTYYIGDICYVVSHETFRFVAEGQHRNYCNFMTTYGDGIYVDNNEKKYPVDSGTIGLVNVKYLNIEKLNDVLKNEFGNVYEFTTRFTCENDNGKMRFGNVTINTY